MRSNRIGNIFLCVDIMKYIVFDLEWNQASNIHYSDSRMQFEIIEIAALKLDEKLNIVDEFQSIVRPKLYKTLNPVIKEITGFTEEELSKGQDFKTVADKFVKWCGKDYMFCTWATQDLNELQNNMRYYGMKLVEKAPLLYYDIQKLFSIQLENNASRRSLEYAVEFLGIEKKEEFHRAGADAYYTAQVMKHIDMEKVKQVVSIDTFVIPKNKKEEFSVSYNDSVRFVSRGYDSRSRLFNDKKLKNVRCPKCNSKVMRKQGWFSDGSKTYYYIGECSVHGYVSGKIRVKKSPFNEIYAIKYVAMADKEDYGKILEKKQQVREKRRQKKNKK